MGWSFRVTCPDCLHGWQGIQTSYEDWRLGRDR